MSNKETDYNNEVFNAFYAQAQEENKPQLAEYVPEDETTLLGRLSQVLRPIYDRAIAALSQSRKRASAELDADALSRGMGSSTFVTDVKQRQQAQEASDLWDLESDYGAKLSEQLYKALENEKDRMLEVEKFNAEQINEANLRAFEMAQVLYEAYLASRKKGGSGGTKPATLTEDEFTTTLALAVAEARGQAPENANTGAILASGGNIKAIKDSDLTKNVKAWSGFTTALK